MVQTYLHSNLYAECTVKKQGHMALILWGEKSYNTTALWLWFVPWVNCMLRIRTGQLLQLQTCNCCVAYWVCNSWKLPVFWIKKNKMLPVLRYDCFSWPEITSFWRLYRFYMTLYFSLSTWHFCETSNQARCKKQLTNKQNPTTNWHTFSQLQSIWFCKPSDMRECPHTVVQAVIKRGAVHYGFKAGPKEPCLYMYYLHICIYKEYTFGGLATEEQLLSIQLHHSPSSEGQREKIQWERKTSSWVDIRSSLTKGKGEKIKNKNKAKEEDNY